MMVRDAFSSALCRLTLRTGTGLSDGFPPGGIDAHDVRVLSSPLPHRVQGLTAHSPTNFSLNFPMTCSLSESTRLSINYLLHAELTHAAAEPATSYTSMRMRSTCTRTLPPNSPAGTFPQMSISPLRAQTAPQSACPSEVSCDLVMSPVDHFLIVCLFRRSLREVQDAKVSCTPWHGTDHELSYVHV